jgi:secreted trypsin-like serine protease
MASLRLVIAGFLTLLALVGAPTASAVVNGEVDTKRDFVVLVEIQVLLPGAPGWLSPGTCSGTLVDADTVVTAAHCMFTPPLPPGSRVRFVVNQGDSLAEATATSTGTFISHPGFCFPCAGGPDPTFPANNDLAVIQLDNPMPGPYAKLPKPDSAAKKFDKPKNVKVVGFGRVDPSSNAGIRIRRVADSRAQLVGPGSPNWLVAPSQAKSKYGYACGGDSGGANLVGRTLVAVTSVGDNACGGPTYLFRVDTPSALAFLGQFVDLKGSGKDDDEDEDDDDD